jgi:uncharacterized phiE125 gp8 family phage protein
MLTSPYRDRYHRPDRVAITVVTPPVEEPLSVDDVKSWLRGYDASDTSEDFTIESLIRAARHQVEEDTGLKLMTQTVDQTVDQFPCGLEPVQLYVGPVQSVTSVTVHSSTDVSSVVATTVYFLDTSRRAARLCLKTSQAWPTDLRWQVAAVVRVVVGYTSAGLIPEPLLHAMRLLIEHWHHDCEGESSKTAPRIETAYEALIKHYRLEWL